MVSGVQLGNVWIGVQPALGIEGDPMRLLFERDLTPHPQYAAFYHWLSHQFGANAILHFGMHGTAEWLPGSPLGMQGCTWHNTHVCAACFARHCAHCLWWFHMLGCDSHQAAYMGYTSVHGLRSKCHRA